VSDNHLTKYISYLKYEKNLTDNSVDAYLRDLQKLSSWTEGRAPSVAALQPLDLEAFLCSLCEVGITPTSQRRILSGVKSYFRFLLLEHVIEQDPSELIEAPKVGQHLPTVLTLEEVNRVIAQPDVSTPLGQRNRAILETLYSCGVRVSELIGLRISNIYEKDGYIRVDGKGRKQRIVPIAESALREIHNYFLFRYEMDVKPGSEDIVFLNRFGGAMTRMAVFNIIKQYCAEAGIQKEVSPHTFRHTFATHLLEGGANLRAIQMMLGHEQISTTELYSQVDRQFLKEEILTHHPRNKS
jgi:integrase/recombinase XerD